MEYLRTISSSKYKLTNLTHNRQEGVPQGWYFPKNVTVTTPDGQNIVARTYEETHNPNKTMEAEDIPPERRPSSTYLLVNMYRELAPSYF